jgi:hypothetical protein
MFYVIGKVLSGLNLLTIAISKIVAVNPLARKIAIGSEGWKKKDGRKWKVKKALKLKQVNSNFLMK